MGCKTSKMCCPQLRKKKRQKAHQGGLTSQELNDLNAKTQGPNEVLQKIKEYEQEIRDLLQKHQEEKTALADAHKADVEARTLELQAQAQKDRDAETAKLLSEQAATMKAEMEEKFAELQKSFEQEKVSLTQTHQQFTDALQETVDELNSQLASFREKMKRVEESVLRQDYRRHIQDHGSPGQFWEQELQSLHFVIEMKSELIREQDKRLRNHESTMERNLVLEERSRTLQQENEALKVQTQKQGAVTVRLSEELLSTQVSLEKQIHRCEQLQREKEQNLYRAVNGDAPQQFSLQSNAQELPVMVL
uniref:Coiled-coil domain-containing protein 69-A n=1 Tax=Xenopus laevis TaxID=8355 RepID=CC69A_XENLA|nr:RecName: Full=Coiled-coil domain-containing protein 69-A [Xenopus laevis]AAH78114.1 MGC83627 protein [Xenopus laevis]